MEHNDRNIQKYFLSIKRILPPILIFLLILFLVSCSIKYENKHPINTINLIEKLGSSNISRFDFFLYRLYDYTKCDLWYSTAPTLRPKICMTKFPQYNHSNNTIKLSFVFDIDPTDSSDKKFQDFISRLNRTKKSELLTQELEDLVYQLGLTIDKNSWSNKKFITLGILDDILISMNVDKDTIVDIKKSISINARFSYEKNMTLLGERDTNGKINIKIMKPKITVL